LREKFEINDVSLFTLLLCWFRDTFAALGCDSLYLTPYEMSQDCFDIMDTLFTYIDDLNPCTYCYTNELHSAICTSQIRR
jgi:hypothetical protein